MSKNDYENAPAESPQSLVSSRGSHRIQACDMSYPYLGQCPMGPIDPIGRPTIGGNVILQMFFKKTEEWPKTKSADGKADLTHAQMIDRSVNSACPRR